MMTIQEKLISAVTQYDSKQSKKSSYNRYALGIYFTRVDDIMKDIEGGATPRKAIIAGFEGRLADFCLKAIGEPKYSIEERDSSSWVYKPNSLKS